MSSDDKQAACTRALGSCSHTKRAHTSAQSFANFGSEVHRKQVVVVIPSVPSPIPSGSVHSLDEAKCRMRH